MAGLDGWDMDLLWDLSRRLLIYESMLRVPARHAGGLPKQRGTCSLSPAPVKQNEHSTGNQCRLFNLLARAQ